MPAIPAIPAMPAAAMDPIELIPPADMKLLGGPILLDMRLPAPNMELWFIPDMYGFVPMAGGYLGVKSISDDRLGTDDRDSEGKKGCDEMTASPFSSPECLTLL